MVKYLENVMGKKGKRNRIIQNIARTFLDTAH